MIQKRQLRGMWAVGCALVLTLVLSLYSQPNSAGAHGTDINYSIESTVVIAANFDTGEPMSEAQITVFAPSDPTSAWLQGVADENGTFTFVPDPEVVGSYDVRVRTAGHGEIITVPVGGGTAAETGSTSTMQQLIMAAAVIWGFIGTALYFSARNQSRNSTKKSEGNQDYAHT